MDELNKNLLEKKTDYYYENKKNLYKSEYIYFILKIKLINI